MSTVENWSDKQARITHRIKELAYKKNPTSLYLEPFTRGGGFVLPEYDLADLGVMEDVDSFVKQGILRKTGLGIKEGYSLQGKNKAVIKYVKERIRAAEIAARQPFLLLLRQTLRDLNLYGNTFWVKVRDPKISPGRMRLSPRGAPVKPIAAYFHMSPETVQVKLGKSGQIIGYRHRIPGGYKYKDFLAKDIIHFKYDTKGHFIFATPTMMPLVDDIKALRRIEENLELLIHQYLFPLYHVIVGTPEQPADVTSDGMSEVDYYTLELEYMPAEGGLVTSERVKIDPIGAEGRALQIQGYLEHFRNRVITGTGLSSVDFGMAGTSNKSTAIQMSRQGIDTVKDVQSVLAEQITMYVIDELLLESPWGNKALIDQNRVQFVFNEIDWELRIKRENHAMLLYHGNAITEDELRRRFGAEPLSKTERKGLFAYKVPSGQTGIQPSTRNKEQPTNQHGTKSGPDQPVNNSINQLKLALDSLQETLSDATAFPAKEKSRLWHDRVLSALDQISKQAAEKGWKEVTKKAPIKEVEFARPLLERVSLVVDDMLKEVCRLVDIIISWIV